MKGLLSSFAAFLFIIASSCLFVHGQASASARMFAGEKLTYEGRISKLKIGVSVAELTFSAGAAPTSNEIFINTEAVSKGTLLKLFRFSFTQQYDSTATIDTFKVVRTTKHDVQKERVRDGEAIFDYAEKRVRYTETDPKDKNRPPRRIASEITDPMHDMITAIYAVRLMPLKIGDRIDLSVSDSGLVYRVPVNVIGREKLNTVLGKVWCLKVQPDIFGPGRLIETQKGKMVIWLTDDARHTPVKAQLNTGFGRIDIKLKAAVNPS